MGKIKDITGMKFGKLTVLYFDNETYEKERQEYFNGDKEHFPTRRWKCMCNCENHTIVSITTSNLISGNTKSCGCDMKKDLTGEQFGRWKVIELDKERSDFEYERYKRGEIKNKPSLFYKCECSCENKTIKSIDARALTNGSSLSCGCVRKENKNKYKDLLNIYVFLEDLNCYKVYDYKKADYFLVDSEDVNFIKNKYWRKDNRGYWVSGKEILHKEIMKRIDESYKSSNHFIIDHIDNKYTINKQDDNRRCNLRLVSRKENQRNQKITTRNKSGITGVHLHKASNKYIAQIGTYGKDDFRHEYFNTFEEAVKQRKEWEKKFDYSENHGK